MTWVTPSIGSGAQQAGVHVVEAAVVGQAFAHPIDGRVEVTPDGEDHRLGLGRAGRQLCVAVGEGLGVAPRERGRRRRPRRPGCRRRSAGPQRPAARAARAAAGERPVEVVAALAQEPAGDPEEPQARGKLLRRGHLGRLAQAVLHRRLEVGVLAGQGAGPVHLPRPGPGRLGALGQRDVVVAVPPRDPVVFRESASRCAAVLAQGLQHPVAGGLAVVVADQDRLVDQRGQHVDQVAALARRRRRPVRPRRGRIRRRRPTAGPTAAARPGCTTRSSSRCRRAGSAAGSARCGRRG